MTDWTAGYRTDIDYPEGYFPELNPLYAQFALTLAGIACPPITTACELGFGQGLSLNSHAAGTTAKWYGNDFNAMHTAKAQALAAEVGAGATLTEDSFAEYLKRKDLPDFDLICLHGIWSWVSAENRQLTVDFIRRKLKPGGIVYLSYNTMAGSAAFEPVRHLMQQHAKVMGVQGRGIASKVDGAVGFMNRMFAMNTIYGVLNHSAVLRVQDLATKDKHYLAHEFFNQHWHPMHVTEVAELLQQAKLDFACSSNAIDHVLDANFSAEQQQFLGEIPDTIFREASKDLMMHRQFRKDFWIKGARAMTAAEQRVRLRELRVVMVKARSEVPDKLKCLMGEANMDAKVYQPLLDLMEDHQARTLGEIEKALSKHKLSFAVIKEAVVVLTSQSVFYPAQDKAVAKARWPYCAKLNAALLERARLDMNTPYLVSAVTGGALVVPRVPQLFLLARSLGKKTPASWAAFAWDVLSENGQNLQSEGRDLQTPEENLARLNTTAKWFAESFLPILQALKVVN